MIKFRLPQWLTRQINRKFKRRESLSTRYVLEMEAVMKKAVDFIIENSEGEDFKEPNFHEMFLVSERFYRSVLRNAFDACEEQKMAQTKKRLALGPIGIPRRAKKFNEVLRDSIYWRRVIRRSRYLTERLKKQYLSKLRVKYKEIAPFILSGEMDPREVKNKLMEAWDTTKSRVEVIFRTETTNYFEKSQIEFFRGDPEILGYLFDSVGDSSCTDICKSRHGMVYKNEYTGNESIAHNTPALHYNCRSHMIPLANTPENRKIIDDYRRNPITNRAKIKPLPQGWR